jgi:MYXO-CTERM domain-containing protein
MKTRHAFASLALAAACTLSAAASPPTPTREPLVTWEWGTNPQFAMESLLLFGAQGLEFDAVATFTLDGPFELLAHAVTNDAGPLDIGDAMVTLWRSNGDADYRNDELIGGFDFDTRTMQHRFAGLGSGDYFYLVEGTVLGREGGSLLFSASVSPVPEPAGWALAVAGLGVVGALVRRRVPA